MSRAHGKHTGRTPTIDPDSREGHALGLSDKEIPGGRTHLVNPVVPDPTKPAIPEPRPQFRGIMAHGVPPEGGHHERKDSHHARQEAPAPASKTPRPTPVPVYIVTENSDAKPLLHSAHKHLTAPAAGNEPVSICGQDANRRYVRLLNEDGTHNARFGQLNDLAFDSANSKIVGGSILPKSMTSYLTLETQGPLYICSDDSGTPVVSVIMEYELPGAG